MMRLLPPLHLLAAAVVLMAAFPSLASDLYVISHEPIVMTSDDIKEVFLGEVQFAGSLRLQPIDNAGAQAVFLGNVLKMSAVKYSASWTKKAFRDGLNAPPSKGTDAEALIFVRGTPGAIGYVNAVPRGVHVVAKF